MGVISFYFSYLKNVKLERIDVAILTRILRYAAFYGKVELLKKLLRAGALIPEEYYLESSEDIYLKLDEIQKLMNYRPGRKEKTIYERYQVPFKPTKEQIKKLLLDYEDTTDDESSDEEDIKYLEETVYLKEFPHASENKNKVFENEQFLNQFNQLSDDEKIKPKNNGRLRCIIHRGMHYDPKYFTTANRRNDYKKRLKHPSRRESTLSFATKSLLQKEKESVDNLSDTEVEQSKAHKTVQTFLSKLKATPNKKPRTHDKRKTEHARLIQEYVHNYAKVIDNGGIQTDFDFSYPWNPFISSSYSSQRAFVYASGELQKSRLNPHYRRSTGKPKHPILGVVFSYGIDYKYQQTNSVSILDWNDTNQVGIKGRYQHECEIINESYIPKQYMLKTTLLKVPSFEGTVDYLPACYNYTKWGFTKHQNSVTKLTEKIDSDQSIYNKKSYINLIINYTIDHLYSLLDESVTNLLYQLNLYPCYPFKQGEVTISPVKPPSKGRWSEQTTPSCFNEQQRKKMIKQRAVINENSPYQPPKREYHDYDATGESSSSDGGNSDEDMYEDMSDEDMPEDFYALSISTRI